MNTLIEDTLRQIIREELAAQEPQLPAKCERAHVDLEQRPVSALVVHPADPRQLYSVADAAALLRMSVEWVYRRINDGQLGIVEMGSSRAMRRIAASELGRFIEARSFPAAPEQADRG